MKRKVLTLLLCAFLLMATGIQGFAAETNPHIVDEAELLTDSERMILEASAADLSAKYQMDIVILTVDSLEGTSAERYADGYYDDHGYGIGENYSGILYLLAMQEREWYISTCGDAVYALTDYGIQQLGDDILWLLSDGRYYDAFVSYLDALPHYIESWENGSPVDGHADYSGDYYHGTKEDTVYYEEDTKPNLFLSIIIGVVSAAATILIMRGTMNTKRAQHSAGDYMKSGSFHLRTHQDLFLYSNVSKVRRQQNTSSGGGGSSVHRSSGGRRHGGGGGRF